MKKLIVLLCVLVLVTGIVVAEDIGVTVGVEFYNENINKADGDPTESYIEPYIAYDNTSLLDGALTFHMGVENYNINLAREAGPDGDYFPKDFDFNIWLQYKLSIGSASTLRFYLRDDNNFTISPIHHGVTYEIGSGANTSGGTLTPGLQFNQSMGFGSLYARVRMPYDYVMAGKDDTRVRLQSRLGWNSTFGLGLYAEVRSRLAPDLDLYQFLRLFAEYDTDSFGLFNVLAIIPKEVSNGITIWPHYEYDFENSSFALDCYFNDVGTDDGITIDIEPYVEYRAGAFTFYADFLFENITANGGGMRLSPLLGVKFEF